MARERGLLLSLLAQIRIDPHDGEQRRSARRVLRLEVESAVADGAVRAVVRNLSETGLLIETAAPLKVGDGLTVDLPEAGAVVAKVIWARQPFYGCEFAKAVARGAVSAALLRSPLDEPATTLLSPPDTTWQLPAVDEQRRSLKPSGEAITALVLLGASLAMFVMALITLRVG